MIVYIISSIITGIFLFASEFFYKRYKNLGIKDKNYEFYIIFFILSILPYFIVSGFRYGVGTDYFYTYYPGFYQIMAGNLVYDKEIVFNFLNEILLLFTDDAQIIFIVTGFLFSMFMMLSIKKMTKNWWLAGILVMWSNVFFISLNNVRQFLALSIGIYAYTFAVDKKYTKLVIFFIISIMFHLTALVMIPLYILGILSNHEKLKKYFLIIIIVLLVLSPSYIPLAKLILKNTPYISYFNYGSSNDKPLYWYLIPGAAVLLTSLILYKRILKDNKYSFGLIISLTVAVIIAVLSIELTINETMSRACNWFYFAIIFMIPEILNLFGKKWYFKLLNITLVLVLVGLTIGGTYYMIVVLGHHEVLPFRWYFNPHTFIE